MNFMLNPDTDLTISRIIKAPRAVVWSAWANPRSFEQWWIPEPALCKVVDMDMRAGGAFQTLISENGGPFGPHLDACFLDVAQGERIVFTNALRGGWRPAAQPFMTAIITLADRADGTEYLAQVMHKDNADRNMHSEMGFYEGWGTVIEQLARRLEAA